MSVLEVDYQGLPEGLRDGAQRYVERGVMPGRFLAAVFRNDFTDAALYADMYNQRKLRDIAIWLTNEPPAGCWGSVNVVDGWCRALRRNAAGMGTLERTIADHPPAGSGW
jgi:hypothetical protein